MCAVSIDVLNQLCGCAFFQIFIQIFFEQIIGQSSSSNEECKCIRDLFYKTMPSTAKITNIERVQNGELWMNFVR